MCSARSIASFSLFCFCFLFWMLALLLSPEYHITNSETNMTEAETEESKTIQYVSAQSAPVQRQNSTDTNYNDYLQQLRNDVYALMSEEGMQDEMNRYLISPDLEPTVGVLLASWRTGSTYVGSVLRHYPGAMYVYEPLFMLGLHQARSKELSTFAEESLVNITNCQFPVKYRQASQKIKYAIQTWTEWKETCHRKSTLGIEDCWNSTLLQDLCFIFPYKFFKTVRVRLNSTRALLAQNPSARVIVLGRDPRSVRHSRRDRRFCRGREPLCDDPSLCDDMVSDYHTAELFENLFPGRVRLVRFEDIIANKQYWFRKMATFLQMKYTNSMSNVLLRSEPQRHTKRSLKKNQEFTPQKQKSKTSVYSTQRNSSFEANQWRWEFSWRDIQATEELCDEAMNLWGYRKVPNEEMLQSFESLARFVSPVKL